MSDILESINWVALVSIFCAGPATYSYFNAKTVPKHVSAVCGLFAFAILFSALFLLYRTTGFPYWMRWPNQLVTTQHKSELFEKPNHYKITLSGWQHNTTPDGDVFTCATCESQIQVQIIYGPELGADSKFRTNEEFIALMKQPAIQKEFTDSVLRASLPKDSGATLSIERTGLTKIGGIDALQYMSIIEIPPTPIHETSMIAVHKSRIMKITLSFYDGAMNDEIAKKVNILFSSLKFF